MHGLQLKINELLHGADYNYEQWMDSKAVIDSDFRYMLETKCNVMTVGVFSWSVMEPAEGQFEFAWLDELFERLQTNGIHAILGTPSGSKPAWLSAAYPETCRVDRAGVREPHGHRHNHCRTSPVYRQKCQTINRELAQRYGESPALLMWHVSNEYNAEGCYCDLCLSAFTDWLRTRYGTLDALNHAWWTTFWSHRFTSWEQIVPTDDSIHGLQLDWRRFISDQTLSFYLSELEPLRKLTPHIPVTTNFMQPNVGLNYWHFAEHVDVISWDSYPMWHYDEEEWREGVRTGFFHDLHRSYKGQPFMLMESTPSATNWQGVSIPKKPNMHLLASLQAIAHGSNTVQYFQWRQSRGGTEKFHSAVVSHGGTSDTAVFQDVAAVGRTLDALARVGSTDVKAEVAVVYDLENEWALDQAQLPNQTKLYQERCIAHYASFWRTGVACDVIDSVASPLENYHLVVAPMLYMVREGVPEKLASFVRRGGRLVLTYLSGLVDGSDLCFLGGFPGPLRELAGVGVEDTATLHGRNTQAVKMDTARIPTCDASEYAAADYADRIHLEGATAIGWYTREYMKDMPAVTVNDVGQGQVYYLASRAEDRFLMDFYASLLEMSGLGRDPVCRLPTGVTYRARENDKQQYLFVMNFNPAPRKIDSLNHTYRDLLTGEIVEKDLELQSYGIRVLTPVG